MLEHIMCYIKDIHIILVQYFNQSLDYNSCNVKLPFKLLLIILSYIMALQNLSQL